MGGKFITYYASRVAGQQFEFHSNILDITDIFQARNLKLKFHSESRRMLNDKKII